MPLLAHALSVTNPQVQHKALKALPPLVDQVDYGTLRTTIYPKLEVGGRSGGIGAAAPRSLTSGPAGRAKAVATDRSY